MLIIYNDSPKKFSKIARSVVGRYCWKIGRDLWIWPTMSIRNEILKDLEQYEKNIRLVFIWKDSNKFLGFNFYAYGTTKTRQNSEGLFNHKAKFDGEIDE